MYAVLEIWNQCNFSLWLPSTSFFLFIVSPQDFYAPFLPPESSEVVFSSPLPRSPLSVFFYAEQFSSLMISVLLVDTAILSPNESKYPFSLIISSEFPSNLFFLLHTDGLSLVLLSMLSVTCGQLGSKNIK